MACGTTMQAAIRIGAHWLERVVTTPAINGSIAALASCSSRMLPAKISNARLAHQVENAGGLDVVGLALDRAMRPRRIDLVLADLGQRQQSGYRQHEGDDEHRTAGQQISGRAHHRGGRSVAERGETGVAPEPLADRQRSDQTKADRGNRRTEHAARGGVQRRSRDHDRKDRPYRITERADADGRDRETRDQPFGAREHRQWRRRAFARSGR